MTSDRWQRIENLFHAALAQDEASRSAFLQTACDGDVELRLEVESLLAREPSAERFIEAPALDMAAQMVTDASERSLIGQQIGHYQLLSRLGAGGMGEVYLGRDVRLGRHVAIKMLPQELRDDPIRTDRFLREARAASALNHPNIVTVYDIGQAPAGWFIAMEFIKGEPLREWIKLRPLDLTGGLPLIAQAARALAAAHASGIVHRDIKPENIMVREDGYVKVVDFGLARQVIIDGAADTGAETEAVTAAGAILGTYRYMSPEQATAKEISAASDVFSLGIVLYEMVTGFHPFPAETALGSVLAIISGSALSPSRSNPEISPELDALVLRMLEKDPRHRPSAEEVLGELEAIARGHDGSSGLIVTTRPGPRLTVGREAEQKMLRAALERVRPGHCAVVVVAAEAGLGKTTLVEEFLADLALSSPRVRIARGRCSERFAGTGAYLPLIEALQSLVRGPAGGGAARVLKAVAPSWHDQMTTVTTDVAALPPKSAEQMKRELAAAFDELGAQAPLILFLDDLQWVDPSTVDVMSYLATRQVAAPLFIIGTLRSDEPLLAKHPFAQLERDLIGRGVCDELCLESLTTTDVAKYINLAFADHDFPSEFYGLIYRRTEGHPLFLTDLLRYLKDRGAIARNNGRWQLTGTLDSIEEVLPQSVRSMIDRKLELLTDSERKLLVAASVEGDVFDVAVVSAAIDLDPADVEEQFEPLEHQHRVIRLVDEHELPDGTLTARYRFAHALYQNALYTSLRPARRAALSRTIAEILQRAYGDDSSPIASQLAFLWEAARDFDKAAAHYLVASERAQRVAAMQEAATLARRGLQALSALPDDAARDRREIALQVALFVPTVAITTHNAPEVKAAFDRVHQLCKKLGEVNSLFASLVGRVWAGVAGGESWKARDAAVECLQLAEQAGDPGLLAAAHFAAAGAATQLAELRDACGHYERVLALYDPQAHQHLASLFVSDPGVHGRAEYANVLFIMGQFSRALALAEQSISMGRELGHPLSLSIALQRTFKLLIHSGQLAAAQRLLAELEVLWAERDLMHRHWQPYYRGWLAALDGDVGSGTADMRRAMDLLKAIGFRYDGPTLSATVIELWLAAGRLDEAMGLADAALTEARQIGELRIIPELLRLRGALLLNGVASTDSDNTDGEATLRAAIALARDHDEGWYELRATTTLAAWLAQRGHAEDALPLVKGIVERFDKDTGTHVPDLVEARALAASVTSA